MQLKNICFTAICLSIISQNIFAADDSLTFKNQRGSVLHLTIHSDNTLDGYFTTAVASKSCQQYIGKKRPIMGYIVKNALTVSASYPECGVLTYIGHINENQKMIDVTAVVAHPSQPSTKEWNDAKMLGHDVFIRS